MIDTQMKQIMSYLRNLKSPQRNAGWPEKEAWRDKVVSDLERLGAKFIASGASTRCFRVGNFIIKFSLHDNFTNLTPNIRQNPMFKRLAPPVYWIHASGYLLLCKFVQWVRTYINHEEPWCKHGRIRDRVERVMQKAGLNPCDLHNANLVKVANTHKLMVIDYGCFVFL